MKLIDKEMAARQGDLDNLLARFPLFGWAVEQPRSGTGAAIEHQREASDFAVDVAVIMRKVDACSRAIVGT